MSQKCERMTKRENQNQRVGRSAGGATDTDGCGHDQPTQIGQYMYMYVYTCMLD